MDEATIAHDLEEYVQQIEDGMETEKQRFFFF